MPRAMNVEIAPENQDEVIDFLSRPESYGLHGGSVERIETHCSIVFLAADRAYKLKRTIRYAALDYTTLALRQAACAAELVLNRRTAPDIYLGVHAICRNAHGELAFEGPGTVLEHVVVMRRFAQTALFDHMFDHGGLTHPLMQALGRVIARLHIAAERTPDYGGSTAIRRVIADNATELARVAVVLDGADVSKLSSGAAVALDAVAALLDQRQREGKVRRCHGDLRLANICLWSGAPTPFDAIEFSDEISCIDVLYDLAFPLMDLQMHGRGDLANAVFNAYLDLAPETEGLRALPLFLALRAATRSYTLAGSAGRQADAAQAVRKLALARQHISAGIGFLAPSTPLLLTLAGGTGAERENFAAQLAGMIPPAPGARLLRLDTPKPELSTILNAGCSVLLHGSFMDAATLQQAATAAARCNAWFLGLWLGSAPVWAQPLCRSLPTGETALASILPLLDADQCQSTANGLQSPEDKN